KAPAGVLLLQLALDFRPGGLEALHFPRLDTRDLDDMEAEIRLDEVADLIRLELERCILEGAHHHPAREEAEVPAPGSGARIAGIFLRELRETARRFAQLRQNLRGALPRRRLLGVARVPLHGDQDMARTAL